MSLHQLLPLAALLLNILLAAVSLARNAGSRLNRVFAYFVGGMAVWNFGVFMLRRSPDEPTAFFWEVVIHGGVIALPAFYYHFVLIFIDSTTIHRRSLFLAYALSLLFTALNVTGSPLFMKGVNQTYWGWAPRTGIFYLPFFVFFNAFLIAGLCRLLKAHKGFDSSFRRNRARLILLGTAVSLVGGAIDFIRFILARSFPAVDHVYPVGIPINMFFALVLGVSIVRYRLFDVNVAVKKTAVYGVVGVIVTGLLTLVARTTDHYFDLHWANLDLLWLTVPLGLTTTLLLSPVGQPLDDFVHRLMFSKRRGCYDTLLQLSQRMGSILDFGRLVDTIVHGLVERIPLTHCALLIFDEETKCFVLAREQSALREGDAAGVSAIHADSPIAQWLGRSGKVLVKEEVKLNPEMSNYLEPAETELDEMRAAVIVPLKVESKLIGILLLGEKLSGEIFENQELEILSVLANQAATSLANARLYQELGASNTQLMQANRLKSEFLASMSHELRTPLNSVIGFSKVLLKKIDGDLNEQQETYLRSVHKSSTHLLHVINDILDISRIELGKIDINPESIDLGELIESCLQSSLPLVGDKELKLETEVAIELPRIRADRKAITQVLLNLLSNAVKFTAAGRVLVRADAEGDEIHVSVTDSGIGIGATDISRLFQPFQRLDSALAQEMGGTGLGLAISKKLVELHGGRIWVESPDRQGSTFHVTLPITCN